MNKNQPNYLLFIIDSLNYKYVKESKHELMPFFSKIEKEGVCCENMYSQAPYTEAAVMNIYCGTNVLDNNGYIFRFKNAPKTIFEAMQEKGYETFFNSYQPQCHPSSVRRGIDHLYYNVGYDQGALWTYRLSHFSGLLKNGSLTEKDYCVLYEIFDDNFSEWIRFTEDIINKDESTNMIIDNTKSYDAHYVKSLVEAEYNKYTKSKSAYIDTVLTEGMNHIIFSIPAYVQDKKINNRASIEEINKELKPLFKKIRRNNFIYNIKNARGLLIPSWNKFKLLIKKPSVFSLKEFVKSLLGVGNQLIDLDLYERINSDCDLFKNAPSGITHIDHFIDWTDRRSDSKPYFACLHIDDIHNPEIFYTYDTENVDLIKKEVKVANSLIDNLEKGYYGSITHDLSLRYIDGVIEYLYKKLEEKGLADNTNVIICADHGFSFAGNPIRDSYVINLYLENYNIPFVMTGKDIEQKKLDGLYTSKDIAATICDLVDGSIPEAFNGRSIMNDIPYDNLFIEYCGGGCPDIMRRELKIAAFNKKYFVGTLSKMDQDIDYTTITEIYDLEVDPRQETNIRDNISINNSEIDELIEKIIARKKDILQQLQL